MNPYMRYLDEEGGAFLEFRWDGGQYICIGYGSPHDPREFITDDVINTVDADDERMPVTLDAFHAACLEYLARLLYDATHVE